MTHGVKGCGISLIATSKSLLPTFYEDVIVISRQSYFFILWMYLILKVTSLFCMILVWGHLHESVVITFHGVMIMDIKSPPTSQISFLDYKSALS